MMTVRFPNGQALQYNTAGFANRHAVGYTDLYVKEGGRWIVQVPNPCVIEGDPACRVYNPLNVNTEEKLAALAKEIRLLKRKVTGK